MSATWQATARRTGGHALHVRRPAGHPTRFHDGGTPEKVYRAPEWLSPILVVSGLPAGVRSREDGGGRAAVTAGPFRSLSAAARKVVLNEADRRDDPTEVHWVG